MGTLLAAAAAAAMVGVASAAVGEADD
eukprot:SAG25_NODE_5069_length_707_cov_1.037829_2_plen_26_part_01